jgi:hexosaminidase
MEFPRLPGYAEIGWSPQSTHDWNSYKVRLAAQGPRWDVMGVNYYHSAEVPWPSSN